MSSLPTPPGGGGGGKGPGGLPRPMQLPGMPGGGGGGKGGGPPAPPGMPGKGGSGGPPSPFANPTQKLNALRGGAETVMNVLPGGNKDWSKWMGDRVGPNNQGHIDQMNELAGRGGGRHGSRPQGFANRQEQMDYYKQQEQGAEQGPGAGGSGSSAGGRGGRGGGRA